MMIEEKVIAFKKQYMQYKEKEKELKTQLSETKRKKRLSLKNLKYYQNQVQKRR